MTDPQLEAIRELVAAARAHRAAWAYLRRRCGCAVCRAISNYDYVTDEFKENEDAATSSL